MRSARNQFILLGLIAQTLSWDDFIWPLVAILIWIACLALPKRPIRISPTVEGLALIAGSAAGYFLAGAMDKTTHFFIGYGLALVQICRLLRPLTRRERSFTILIAFFHLGVACTILLDYRFLLILLASFWLIPRVFMEFEAEQFSERAARTMRPGRAKYSAVFLITLLFFLVFPRGFLETNLPAHQGAGSGAGSLTDMIDPTRGGSAQPARVLLQIEGENVGYLKCFVLGHFDGSRWHLDRRTFRRPIPAVPSDRLEGLRSRTVRVKNARFLASILPTDGPVVSVTGSFFREPHENSHGAIEAGQMWNTPNNVYHYWITPDSETETLSYGHQDYYTRHPAPSERLILWMDELLHEVESPSDKARQFERHLRDNFTYKMGAPALSRIDTLDDFLFNQRQGHCERFASSLALLLRMQGIPSRVVIGYVPGTRNRFSGWYNVRFKDAHAWTEAHIEGQGWMRLDATPRGAAPPGLTSWNLTELMETLDWFWYSNVVALDSATQRQFVAVSVRSLRQSAAWLADRTLWTAMTLLALLGVVIGRGVRRTRPDRRARARTSCIMLAEHFYGKMLRSLARKGFHRQPHQTPLEFLADLHNGGAPFAAEAEFVTRAFCSARYGQAEISREQIRQVEQALEGMENRQPIPKGHRAGQVR